MMLSRQFVKRILIVTTIGVVLLGQVSLAHASSRKKRHHNRRAYRHHYSSPYTKAVVFLPFGSISLKIGGEKYHYHDGRYYRRHGHQYRIVSAPIGACITRLPRGYHTVYIHGHRYYIHDEVYYEHTPEGYLVVPPPQYKVAKTVQVVPNNLNKGYSETGESFTVNIPNMRGGYSPVTLTRSGEGFVGPQGEYYAEFPRVEQLKAMYGT